MQLERMDDFFAARVDGYDEHMRRDIEGGSAFYAYTAALLPAFPGARILDLGCGTGLELEEYFRLAPDARITGIDLSDVMLSALRAKFPGKDITLINASYFDTPFGIEAYDGAVSVESLHHFPADMKLGLYRRLYEALKPGGVFALTDYFAESPELEIEYFRDLEALMRDQGLDKSAVYHYDTPLTVEHETELLKTAGFTRVTVKMCWGTSYTLEAGR